MTTDQTIQINSLTEGGNGKGRNTTGKCTAEKHVAKQKPRLLCFHLNLDSNPPLDPILMSESSPDMNLDLKSPGSKQVKPIQVLGFSSTTPAHDPGWIFTLNFDQAPGSIVSWMWFFPDRIIQNPAMFPLPCIHVCSMMILFAYMFFFLLCLILTNEKKKKHNMKMYHILT